MNERIIPALLAMMVSAWPCAGHGRGDNAKPTLGKTQHLASSDQVPHGLSAAEWSKIRATYETWRHAVAKQENGDLTARNPGQRWSTRFDGRGFTVNPDTGEWNWGLELRRYGFPGLERAVGEATHVSHEREVVHYERDAVLREWFINDRRGFQQGWTLRERPVGAEDGKPLRLELAVRGELVPRVRPDGARVCFMNAAGNPVLDFGGLRAWDAAGRPLPVRFETEDGNGGTLHVVVEESGARYPIVVDPIAQLAYLKASNTGADDGFGWSVAVSRDTVVVGALEDSSATGINGNQADNSAADSGAAYVFVRSGDSWVQQAYLKASNTGASDCFGLSVAISDNTIVVGAAGEDSGANGVNGNQADNSASSAGAAYVFVRSGTNWSQEAYLKASNTDAGDGFGVSVAVSGDTVVVGARNECSSATGVNGNQADNSRTQSGAAYVFVRSGTNWSQQAYLKASNTDAFDMFGEAMAVSGDTVVVGANYEASAATGVNGNGSDNSAPYAGAAYVFVRSGTNWSQQAYLKASNTEMQDEFGISVAVSGDTVVAGTMGEASAATGVNGNQFDNSMSQSGAAYVFVRSGTNWSQQAYLKASNTEANDGFGRPVAVSGDRIVVAAIGEDSNATGVNGNQADNSMSQSGAAYVFARSGTNWSQQAYLKASNTAPGDYFGYSAGASEYTVVIGSVSESSAATGVNGNQADNSASHAGAAYVFHHSLKQEISVEQPTGSYPVDGGSRDFGPFPCNSATSMTFTIWNIGDSNLTGLAVSKDGANAADFTVLASPVAPLAPGSNTTLTIQFSPTGSGVKTAAFHIESNDEDESPFDITLTGRGLSTAEDTDGDGMNDAAEFRLAPLGFNWQASNSGLVSTYYAWASTAGLYSEGDFRNLYVGAPLVGVSNGTVVLELQLQKSDDLEHWTPFGDPVQWTEPASDKCFYRLFFDAGAQP